MQIKIHQIRGAESIKNTSYAFRVGGLAKDKFDIKGYNFCYEYEIDSTGKSVGEVLEELFEIFNLNHPSDFKGHSLSVSDVVEIDSKLYYYDIIGWKKI